MINLGSEAGALSLCKKICIETSNICNYNHQKCPASRRDGPKFLRSNEVMRIFAKISGVNNGWDGVIAFHNYNEPLEDPRLTELCVMAKLWLNKARIQIWTNGAKLTQELVDDMAPFLDELSISIYSKAEEKRITSIDFGNIDTYIHPSSELDDRLLQYDKPEIYLPHPCHQPFRNIVVRHYGKVALCCLDWRGDHDFGTFEEFLVSDEAWDIYLALNSGNRMPSLCRKCSWRNR